MSIIRTQIRYSVFLQLPEIETAAVQRTFQESFELSLKTGATALFLIPPFKLVQSTLNLSKRIAAECFQSGVSCFFLNDILLNLKAGGKGVLFTGCPDSYSRAREILGPHQFIGRNINSFEEVTQIKEFGSFEHLDFCTVGRIVQETSLQTWNKRCAGTNRLSFVPKSFHFGTQDAAETLAITRCLNDKPFISLSSVRDHKQSMSRQADGTEIEIEELPELFAERTHWKEQVNDVQNTVGFNRRV